MRHAILSVRDSSVEITLELVAKYQRCKTSATVVYGRRSPLHLDADQLDQLCRGDAPGRRMDICNGFKFGE